jgi:HK97 family phage portal protein
MTLLGGLFGEKATTLTVRDDIITSDRLIGDLSGMFGSVTLAADYTATYEEIVRKQLWARIAVNKISYGIGRISLKTYQGEGDDDRERVRNGSLPALIRRPNDTKETGTAPGFLARVAYDLMTYSNALIVKVQARPDVAPSQLRPVNPRGCVIAGNGDYVWNQHLANERRFKPWQIIHIVEPGPTNSGFGVSRLEAARLTLSIEYNLQRHAAATFQNGARPGGIINVKSGLPTSGEGRAAAVERFKSEIMRRFGGPDKAGLPAVLEGDVSWLAMSHNLNDSAAVEHRQLTRDEISGLYDIPPPAIGILDESNFASIDMFHIMFYQDTLGWPIRLIEESLNAQLVDGVSEYAGQFLEFDMNAVMRGDPAARAAYYTAATGRPWMVTDEARVRENLPALGGDAERLVTPLNMGTGEESEQSQEV